MTDPIADEILNRKKVEAAAAAERDRQGKVINAAFEQAKVPLEKLRAHRPWNVNSNEPAEIWHRYLVSIPKSPEWPEQVIVAGDKDAAIRAFKSGGIVSTDHPIRVIEDPHDGDHAALIVQLVQRGHEYAALMQGEGPKQVSRRVQEGAIDDVGAYGACIYQRTASGDAAEVARLIADAREKNIQFGMDVIAWTNWRLGKLVLNIQEPASEEVENQLGVTKKRLGDDPTPTLATASPKTAGTIAAVETLGDVKAVIDRGGQPDSPLWRMMKHYARERFGSLDNSPTFDRIVCETQASQGPEADVMAMRLDNLVVEWQMRPPPSIGAENNAVEQLSCAARAIAMVVEVKRNNGPVPSVRDLAKTVVCSPSTLYRDAQFMAAWLAIQNPPAIPRGQRSASGEVEATAPDDSADDEE